MIWKKLMSEPPSVAGLAALAVCESLLLALNDRNVMPETAIVGVLKDAAQSLTEAPTGDSPQSDNTAAADLLHHIIEGRNSVRRP
jgi:hypothetical protein